MHCLRGAEAIVRSARGLISQPTEKYTSRFSYLILSRLHLRRRRAKRYIGVVCEQKAASIQRGGAAAPCRVLASAKKAAALIGKKNSYHHQPHSKFKAAPLRSFPDRHSSSQALFPRRWKN